MATRTATSAVPLIVVLIVVLLVVVLLASVVTYVMISVVAPPPAVAEGVIRIEPNMPHLVYQIEENSIYPMFESFIGSQVVFVQSDRVVREAMRHDAWVALGRSAGPEAVAEFKRKLDVSHRRRSELIMVEFTDHDPKAALAAVDAVIDSYYKIYVETGLNEAADRLNRLEVRRKKLRDEATALQIALDRIDAGTKTGAGVDRPAIEAELQKTQGELVETERRLEYLTAEASVGGRVKIISKGYLKNGATAD